MLDELSQLLKHVGNPEATRADYLHAIDEENCLGKRSVKTRQLTYKYLVDLYSLDANELLFRALYFYWHRDDSAQPLLALTCAYARDSILREVVPYVLSFSEGEAI